MGDVVKEVKESGELMVEKPCSADFELLKLIGTGSFGKVFLVQKRFGRDHGTLYAMKVLQKSKIHKEFRGQAHVSLERQVLQSIKFPFIVEMKYAFQTSSKLFLVTEYLGGGDFYSRMEKSLLLMEDEARFYLAEILLALEYLHELKIIYRDLKPENIMLDAFGHVKLIDFGLVKEDLLRDQHDTFCGTYEYMAPEIHGYRTHTKAVDWWAFGVLIYEMLTGCTPFNAGHSRQATAKKIFDGVEKLKFPNILTPDAKDVIKQFLRRRPMSRLGCYKSAKLHPFFKTCNWDDVMARKSKPPFIPDEATVRSASLFHSDFTTVQINSSCELEDHENLDSDFTMHFTDFDFVSDELATLKIDRSKLDSSSKELELSQPQSTADSAPQLLQDQTNVIRSNKGRHKRSLSPTEDEPEALTKHWQKYK